MSRIETREHAMELLFQIGFRNDPISDQIDLFREIYPEIIEDEAYFLCERLIDKVRMHHGDLCLLWHNSNINEQTYHGSLYEKVINCI